MRLPLFPLLITTLLLHVGFGTALTFSRAEEISRPEWIWAATERQEPDRIQLRKRFIIEGAVQRADLRLAAEYSRCELRLNAQAVFLLDDYGPWLDIDVTRFVRSGENAIELHCVGSRGPSAIAFELTITMIDGQRLYVRSGADWQTRGSHSGRLEWQPAELFGHVAAELWDADRTARITPFDDYEQWRQAAGEDSSADPSRFLVRPGFEIQRVHSATPDQGSWVSMEFDPQGRLTIAREDRGLLRLTLDSEGLTVAHIESINDSLLECRGLLYFNGSLYAQANNSKTLYRLDDPNGDGIPETIEPIREFPGGVGHGRNDLAPGSDDSIYAIFGDSVELPVGDVTDLTSPFREARRGNRTTEGHVLRYAPATGQWQLFCSGLRNPYGIAFNADAEAFTYDADAEFDMGSPWYRPTRLVHLVAGGDYGWRGRTNTWPPYDADHADFTLPAGNIGKGSPTAVKSGERSSFPPHYRRALFALDWAYGRILACHLVPRGAGYLCRAETFLKGRPLNVTDLDFGPDGSMYVITGGRKTRSDLYCIRWIGDGATGGDGATDEPTPQQMARDHFSRSQRSLRHRLSQLQTTAENPGDAISQALERIGHPDPMLRDAARVLLEQQPVELWSEQAFRLTDPSAVVSCMLSLARSGQRNFIPRILSKLLDVPVASLSGYDRSMLLETWSRCLSQPNATDAPAFPETVRRISEWYPDLSAAFIMPTGAGRSLNHQLALLAEQVAIPDLVPKTLELLNHSVTQEERLHAVFVLRNCREGWSPESRRLVFETLGELDRTVTGGEGMPGFLRRIRQELVAGLSESDRDTLGDLIESGTSREAEPLSISRPFVKKWQPDDLRELLAEGASAPDPERGRQLFQVALCSRCHRAESRGGVIGPDLTSVARRFGRSDILLSILDPSRVVDEKYRSQQVITTDGRVFTGRVVTGGDYRSTMLRLETDPLRPERYIEIDKNNIELHQPSSQSPMPSGLLDTLTREEIRDLLAYLELAAEGSSR